MIAPALYVVAGAGGALATVLGVAGALGLGGRVAVPWLVPLGGLELSLDPLGFGAFQSAGRFRSPSPTGATARPVSALEVDARGFLYAASAEDPDDDAGPFRSAVYRIGRVSEVSGAPRVELFREPQLLGTLDGLKVEAVAAQ